MITETETSIRGIEHLRQSEERFRLLIDSVRDHAIFMLDPTGYVPTWNAGAERFKGCRADEIVAAASRASTRPRRSLEACPITNWRWRSAFGSFEEEGWRVHKDGSLFWANVADLVGR